MTPTTTTTGTTHVPTTTTVSLARAAAAVASVLLVHRLATRAGADGKVRGQSQGSVRRLYWVKRWLYRGGRPGRLARVLNRFWAVQFSAGRMSNGRAATLEV